MRVDSNANRKPLTIDAPAFRLLNQMADEEKSFQAAPVAFGVDRKTLIKACKDAGLSSWVAEKFPPRTNKGKVRKQPAGPVVPNSVQARWLSVAWRVS